MGIKGWILGLAAAGAAGEYGIARYFFHRTVVRGNAKRDRTRKMAGTDWDAYIPGIRAYLPEATYFLWIDFSPAGLSPEQIIEKCVYQAHVAVTRGTEFIEGGQSFVRLNYACPRSLLKEALQRLEKVLNP